MEQQLILTNSIDLTFMISVEAGRYRFITVNDAFLTAAALTKEQVEGKYVEEILPEALRPFILPKYDQAIRERQTVQWENTTDYPGGRRTDIISITPVFNEQGICTILVGTVHDITERKKTEEKIRSREKQLDLIYNTVSDVIFLLTIEPGPRFKFSTVNSAFLASTGLSREQVEGRYVDEIIPQPSLGLVLGNYRQAIETRSKVQWEETTPYPSGARTGIVTITPVFNESGECDMLVGAVHDITERKKTQEEKDNIAYSLGERVKELTTLYKVSQLLHVEGTPMNDVMQSIVNLLPAGWQYPPITAGRIVLGNKEFKTSNYIDSPYRQAASFPIYDDSNGSIEVIYLEEKRAEAEGPFLAEERNLINMLAEMLQIYFSRKTSEEQLVKQNILLESMMNSLPGIFYLQEITGEFMRWNKKLETVTGYSAGEINRMHALEFLDEEGKKLLMGKSREMYVNGSVDVEAEIITKEGERIPHYFTGQLIEYEGRTCIIGMGIDITERMKVEESNRKNQERFRVLVDSAPDATVIVNEKGLIQLVNRQTELILGYTREELIGKPVEVLIPSEFHSRHHGYRENFQKETRTREMGMGMELYAVKKDGTKIPVEISLSPFHSDEGVLVTASIRDITERKKVAEQLQKERDLSNRIIETLPGLFYMIDEKGKYLRWNKLKETMSGYTHEEMASMNSLDFFAGEEKEMIAKAISDGFKNGHTEVEAHVLTKDGRRILHYFTGVVIDYEGKTCLMGMGMDITERRRAAEELLKQKELLESLINSLPGIFYLFDNTGKYLLWNKNHETVPGYSTEEMRSMYPLNFFEGDEKERVKKEIEKVFTTGYAEVEADFLTKEGKKIPHYFNGIAIDYDNKPCLMGVGIDITERKKMETELREAEIKFRTLVERSQVGVYIVQKGKFTYVNPRFAEIFGYAQEELIGEEPVKKIISEEYQSIAAENVRARMTGEVETVHYEASGKRKDGTINRIEFYGSRTLSGGEPTIIGTMVDITERKLAEEALQKSEANMHTLFDNTDTIYLLLDTDFRVISFNQRADDFVKNELHSELLINTFIADHFPQQRRKALNQRMQKVLAGESVHYESNYVQPDGSVNWYYVRMFPVSGNADAIFGLMIAVSDITEKKLLEQEIMDQKVQEQKKMTRAVLNAQEKERNKIGQELHDNVNQILVGAKMYLGTIRDKNPVNPDIIRQSIGLVDNAINEIRSLTREQVTPQRQIDLKDLIQSLVDNMKRHSRLETEFIYDIGDFAIKDDLKINIYRIVQEGINNILKHADAQRVSIAVKADARGLHVVITDDGKGFRYSVAGTRGVGITNILNRVESYNGRVFIESQPGPGCKIDITVPI